MMGEGEDYGGEEGEAMMREGEGYGGEEEQG